MADMNAQNTTRKEYIETEDESIIPELAPISELYLGDTVATFPRNNIDIRHCLKYLRGQKRN